MGERWRIYLLGTPRIYYGNEAVTDLQNPKTDALLAYLAFYRQRPHSREELAELLWPGADPDSGRNRLSLALARLRQRLAVKGGGEAASPLLVQKTRLALNREAVDLDVVVFEEALADAARLAMPDARIAAYSEAIRSYGGDLLPGFYEDWVLKERRRLTEAYIAAHLSLSRLLRERNAPGDLSAAEEHTRTAIAAAPALEEAHLERMRILDAVGRRAEALRQFHELTRVLAEELEETPSPEAIALAERLRVRPETQEANRPGLADTPQQRRNWVKPPAPLTRFFGRESECARIEAAITAGVRCITLLGAGGSGKTRLGIEAARCLSSRFDGVVVWVPLAAVSDARRVPEVIAEALRLERDGADDPTDRIIQRLAPVSAVLLVLDNLEHLFASEAALGLPLLLRRLLEELPGLTLLMTSRQRVGVEGEREISVTPLPLPDITNSALETLERTPSIQLFIDRAQAVQPDFRLTTANASAVAALCGCLEGIPLAIELCAAWAQTLTPAQMLSRLEDRFALLVSQRTDSPERHRTLSAAIAYSYELLPEELKTAFLRLSVFRGGWTIEAAERLGIPVETLTALRERSLIVTSDPAEQANGDTTGDTGMRFTMLETLREFAAVYRTPEETAELRRAHADYFRDLAESLRPRLTGPDQAACFARLQTEHDNLRAALQWYVETGDAERGLHLAVALHIFWHIRGHLGEGLEWLDRLDQGKEGEAALPATLRARARRVRSRLHQWMGDNENARRTAEEALALSQETGEEKDIASALMAIGNAAQFRGDTAVARDAYERSLVIGRAIGNDDITAGSLNNLGLTENAVGNWKAAYTYFDEALTIFRRTGHRNHQATALGNMGVSLIYNGELDAARPCLIEALAIHRSLGSRSGTALVNLAVICRRKADYTAARSFLHEALLDIQSTGQKYLLTGAVREAGHVDVAKEHWERGGYLLGAVSALCETLQMAFPAPEADEMQRSRTALRAALGDTRLEAAWHTGRDAPLPQVIAAALEATRSENLPGKA